MKPSKLTNRSGFTLVELLVVIAVLGVLAAGVLVAIDPLEQLSRGRDSGKMTAVTDLGRAVAKYYTVRSSFPTQDAAWMVALDNNGDIKSLPKNPDTNAGCGTNAIEGTDGATTPTELGYCYRVNTTTNQFVVYTTAESKTFKANASEATADTRCTATGYTAYIIYSSAEGKSGVTCLNVQPNANQTGLN